LVKLRPEPELELECMFVDACVVVTVLQKRLWLTSFLYNPLASRTQLARGHVSHYSLYTIVDDDGKSSLNPNLNPKP